MKQIRVQDGKRLYWASQVSIDAASGTVTLDGKLTIMVYDWTKFSTEVVTKPEIKEKADKDTVSKLGCPV